MTSGLLFSAVRDGYDPLSVVWMEPNLGVLVKIVLLKLKVLLNVWECEGVCVCVVVCV